MEKWLEKDLALKIFSFLLAVVLWFLAIGEQNPPVEETFRNIAIGTNNLAAGLVVLDLQPKTVTVKVQGQRKSMATLDRTDIAATVDLQGVNPGQGTYPISVTLPRGVELKEILPPQAVVVVDSLATRAVPIEVRPAGLPNPDFQVASLKPQVASVTVQGPSGRLRQVDRVLAEIDITGAAADFTRTVPLRPINNEGKVLEGITVSPGIATIEVKMTKLPPSKEVPVQLIISGKPRDGYRVGQYTVTPEKVKIRAAEDRLLTIQRLATRPVDVTGAASDVAATVELQVPPGVTLVDAPTVKVNISIVEALDERVFIDLPLRLRNIAPDLQATANPATVKVTVGASKTLLDKLRPENLEVFVDLEGVGEGASEAVVHVLTPPETRVLAVEPATVTVTLKKK